MPDAPVISAQGLTKQYGEFTAVDGLNLAVHAGEVFGLLGPNGAGKTTTILMLLGLTEPASGTAKVVGHDPTRDPLHVKRMVGYLPDSVGFYDDMTGRENLRYTGRLNRLDEEDIDRRIDELLEQVGLTYARDQELGTYSRGMIQRLGIADALIKEPVVMILDEPTIAIDPEGVTEIQSLIRGLADERQVTVLVASHLLYQMQAICDRVAIFVDGRIIAQGTTQELASELSQGRASYEIDVEGQPGDVEASLAELAGVGSVDRDPVVKGRWRVSMEAGTGQHIATQLVGSGLGVSQLRRTGEDLDEIYRRYFEEVAE